jgi:hypothetical protein
MSLKSSVLTEQERERVRALRDQDNDVKTPEGRRAEWQRLKQTAALAGKTVFRAMWIHLYRVLVIALLWSYALAPAIPVVAPAFQTVFLGSIAAYMIVRKLFAIKN